MSQKYCFGFIGEGINYHICSWIISSHTTVNKNRNKKWAKTRFDESSGKWKKKVKEFFEKIGVLSDHRQSYLPQSDPRLSDPRQSDLPQSYLPQSDPRLSDPRLSDLRRDD